MGVPWGLNLGQQLSWPRKAAVYKHTAVASKVDKNYSTAQHLLFSWEFTHNQSTHSFTEVNCMSLWCLELYMDQRVHWCVTTMSAYSEGGCPRGRNQENFVGCPVLTELQEAWERGACILFMGKKTWKVFRTKKSTLGEMWERKTKKALQKITT